jgi:hypothetical protein
MWDYLRRYFQKLAPSQGSVNLALTPRCGKVESRSCFFPSKGLWMNQSANALTQSSFYWFSPRRYFSANMARPVWTSSGDVLRSSSAGIKDLSLMDLAVRQYEFLHIREIPRRHRSDPQDFILIAKLGFTLL